MRGIFQSGRCLSLLSLCVIDVSFISALLVLAPIKDFLHPKGTVIALIKPQFEAGRKKIPKGGVIKDRNVHEEVLERMLRDFTKEGWNVLGLEPSPIPGRQGTGNISCISVARLQPGTLNVLP